MVEGKARGNELEVKKQFRCKRGEKGSSQGKEKVRRKESQDRVGKR